MRFILASKSPRRKELLSSLGEKMGFEFDIIVEETDETLPEGITPREGVRLLAEKKGSAVAARYPDRVVISSDTLVELGGIPLGKPRDAKDAYNMLSSLSGKGHNVHTGVCVSYRGRVYSETATTEVVFRSLTEREILDYIATGEPMDKAGAYGIQGGAGKFVTEYRGEFDTVVGLSVSLTESLINAALREGKND